MPRLNSKVIVGLRTHRSPDRPEHHFRNRPIANLPHTRPGLSVLHANVVILGRLAEAFEGSVRALPLHQLLQVHQALPLHCRQPFQIACRPRFKGKLYRHIGPRGLPVEHVEVVVVDIRLGGLLIGILQAVLQLQARLALFQQHRLPVKICVTGWPLQFLNELHPVGAGEDRPFSGIYNVVGLEVVKLGLFRFAQHAHADADESAARQSLVIPQGRIPGLEGFHRTGDGIVQLRIVTVEPLPEELVPLVLQAGDHAGPVEPCRPVIAVIGVRKVELCANGAVRDLGPRKIRRHKSPGPARQEQADSFHSYSMTAEVTRRRINGATVFVFVATGPSPAARLPAGQTWTARYFYSYIGEGAGTYCGEIVGKTIIGSVIGYYRESGQRSRKTGQPRKIKCGIAVDAIGKNQKVRREHYLIRIGRSASSFQSGGRAPNAGSKLPAGGQQAKSPRQQITEPDGTTHKRTVARNRKASRKTRLRKGGIVREAVRRRRGAVSADDTGCGKCQVCELRGVGKRRAAYHIVKVDRCAALDGDSKTVCFIRHRSRREKKILGGASWGERRKG